MIRDSLQFGTAEEQAINQYLRDKAENEIGSGDTRFRDWLLDKYELGSEPIQKLVFAALQWESDRIILAVALRRTRDKLRDEYIEYRIENGDARADAYRILFENQTEPME